jgi:hypothetical protein
MKVKAVAGCNVPKEAHPRDYISDAEAVEVPCTAYYLRRIEDGDLVVVSDTEITTKSIKVKEPANGES